MTQSDSSLEKKLLFEKIKKASDKFRSCKKSFEKREKEIREDIKKCEEVVTKIRNKSEW